MLTQLTASVRSVASVSWYRDTMVLESDHALYFRNKAGWIISTLFFVNIAANYFESILYSFRFPDSLVHHSNMWENKLNKPFFHFVEWLFTEKYWNRHIWALQPHEPLNKKISSTLLKWKLSYRVDNFLISFRERCTQWWYQLWDQSIWQTSAARHQMRMAAERPPSLSQVGFGRRKRRRRNSERCVADAWWPLLF